MPSSGLQRRLVASWHPTFALLLARLFHHDGIARFWDVTSRIAVSGGMAGEHSGRLDYSRLPDLLVSFLDSIGNMTTFKDILKSKDVAFFLDEPDFRLKLCSVIACSHTLSTIDLQSIGMTARDAEELRLGLSASRTIDVIKAGYQRSLGDSGAVEFARLLEVNSSLTVLELPHTNIGAEGAAALGEALRVNRSLVRLNLSSNKLRKDGIESLLKPLTATDYHLPDNTVLQILLIGGGSNKLCKKGAKAVSRMLRTNQALTELAVNLNPLSDSGVYTLTDSLTTARICDRFQHQANKALQRLAVGFARKAEGGNGAQGIIKMIENNYSLRGLTLTNFEHSWESEDTKKLFVALQKNVHLQELNLGGCLDGSDTFLDLKKQERFLKSWKVTSSVPFTIEKHERTPSPQQTEPSKIPSPSFCTPKFARVLLCGHPDSGRDGYMNLLKSRFSSGLSSIHVLEESEDLKVSLWNFSHSEIYNCFHTELLLPNLTGSEGGPTSFIIVCNNGTVGRWKNDVEVKDEMSYWLRFIASGITTPTRLAPLIWIALSKKGPCDLAVKDAINSLTLKYSEVLTVEADPLYLDNGKASMDGLKERVVVKLKEIQQELPKVPCASLTAAKSICSKKVKDWLLPAVEVSTFCDGSLPFYEVVHALHDAGEIILFEELEQHQVIVKPDRFISEIIPTLLEFCSKEKFDEGLVAELYLQRRLSAERLLKGTSPDGSLMVLLMRWLKLCYKSTRADKGGDYLFIPATLADTNGDGNACFSGTQQLEWPRNSRGIYLGRRYLSRDKVQTFMNQNLFHQLQLELSRDGDLMTNGHHPECRVTLQRNLIRIVTNSMEILVEFGGFVGYFIDVLVKSQEPYTQTVAFIHKYIRNPITKLSNSTKGLEEGLIRPMCVKMLTPCKYRQSQVVMMKHLIARLREASCPLNYQYPWDEVRDENNTVLLEPGLDLVIGYLDRKDRLDILRRKNISAVPSKNLSDLLTSAPCHFTAAESSISSREEREHGVVSRGKLVAPSPPPWPIILPKAEDQPNWLYLGKVVHWTACCQRKYPLLHISNTCVCAKPFQEVSYHMKYAYR